MNFFFDRCVPIRVARMVDAYEVEHTIRHHDDDARFNPKTKDIEWMRALASDGHLAWIIISGDGRILKNSAEAAVLKEVNLTFFSLSKQWPNTPIPDYAWKFMKTWPRIVEIARHSSHKVFEVAAGKALKVDPIY